MKIEIRPHPEYKDLQEIYVDDVKVREIHRSVFGKTFSFPVPENPEEWERVFEALEYKRVRNYALWRLSVQSYHSEQLTKLLKERSVRLPLVSRIISEFRDLGFLDDRAWIDRFIRTHRPRYSLNRIIAKLYSKGLSRETLDSISREQQNPDEELTSVLNLLKGRYRTKDLRKFEDKQKVIASLIRKGFPYDVVKSAFRNLEHTRNEE